MVNSNSSNIISQIYKSRKNVLDLMDKQGYDTNCYSNFSINEINSLKQNNQLDMLLEAKPPTEENTSITIKNKVYISYYLNKAIRPANLHEMIDDLFVLTETLNKNDTLFVIIKQTVNETLMNELKYIWERDGIYIVIESIKCLQFNILQHHLVPEHIVMKPEEIEIIMKKYNIVDVDQFPSISRFDPVARAICLRPGQLCHIIRSSKTSITSDYYRICV